MLIRKNYRVHGKVEITVYVDVETEAVSMNEAILKIEKAYNNCMHHWFVKNANLKAEEV